MTVQILKSEQISSFSQHFKTGITWHDRFAVRLRAPFVTLLMSMTTSTVSMSASIIVSITVTVTVGTIINCTKSLAMLRLLVLLHGQAQHCTTRNIKAESV